MAWIQPYHPLGEIPCETCGQSKEPTYYWSDYDKWGCVSCAKKYAKENNVTVKVGPGSPKPLRRILSDR